jgi:hypothetical protein
VDKLYDLSARQAEFFVVVEHGVHVLDPDGVDRPVEGYPFEVPVLLGDALAHQ